MFRWKKSTWNEIHPHHDTQPLKAVISQPSKGSYTSGLQGYEKTLNAVASVTTWQLLQTKNQRTKCRPL